VQGRVSDHPQPFGLRTPACPSSEAGGIPGSALTPDRQSDDSN